jgi:autoinducer 2-degrading protein
MGTRRMISLLVTLEIAPDRVDEFLCYIKEEAEDARTKEPGCRRFEISRSVEKTNVFTLTEAYDDLAALEAHRLTPHFLLFRERAQDGLIVSKTSVCGEIIDA